MSYGIERVKGNNLTDLGENGLPRNQKNRLLDVVLTIKLAKKQ